MSFQFAHLPNNLWISWRQGLSFPSCIPHAHPLSSIELQETSLGKWTSTNKLLFPHADGLVRGPAHWATVCLSRWAATPRSVLEPSGIEGHRKNTWEVRGLVVSEIFYLSFGNLAPLLVPYHFPPSWEPTSSALLFFCFGQRRHPLKETACYFKVILIYLKKVIFTTL